MIKVVRHAAQQHPETMKIAWLEVPPVWFSAIFKAGGKDNVESSS
jgi:hypothetical protein